MAQRAMILHLLVKVDFRCITFLMLLGNNCDNVFYFSEVKLQDRILLYFLTGGDN